MINFVTVKKAPEDTLDYSIDFTQWIEDDTIASVLWTIDAGITNVSNSFTPVVATVWLSGGTDGVSYNATAQITTAGGRIKDYTISIQCGER